MSLEAASGIVLLLGAAAALIWANTDTTGYASWWGRTLTIGSGDLAITETLVHWVNDALMTIFFFVVGLEIKRELVTGELRDTSRAALPAIAAIGGMVVPAVVYVLLNLGGTGLDGWAIPMATDIAFAVGVLAILGARVPSSLKVFLLTLAIVDDIGAIVVIALFYSSGVEPLWLLGGVAVVVLVLADVAARDRPTARLRRPGRAPVVVPLRGGHRAHARGRGVGTAHACAPPTRPSGARAARVGPAPGVELRDRARCSRSPMPAWCSRATRSTTRWPAG